MTDASPSTTLELIFLGTGGSSAVPELRCLTETVSSESRPCKTCLSTIDDKEDLIPGHKNIRGNVSVVLRKTWDGEERDKKKESCIIIDCGKTFRASTIALFRKKGIRRIDGCILSHEHADAILGLDDLRGMTVDGSIQDHVDMYCDQRTFDVVEVMFPWCVPGRSRTGSGKLPAMRWHIIEAHKPFEVGGITILPLPVQHGTTKIITRTPSPTGSFFTNTFATTHPMIPKRLAARRGTEIFEQDYNFFTPPATPAIEKMDLPLVGEPRKTETRVPYMILSFLVDQELFYCSDTNRIPRETWEVLRRPRRATDSRQTNEIDLDGPTEIGGEDDDDSENGSNIPSPDSLVPRLPLVVLDIDKWEVDPGKSHLSADQSLRTALALNARDTFLVGMTHDVDHGDLRSLCRDIGVGRSEPSDRSAARMDWYRRNKDLWRELSMRKVRVKPAYDGLHLMLRDGIVRRVASLPVTQ